MLAGDILLNMAHRHSRKKQRGGGARLTQLAFLAGLLVTAALLASAFGADWPQWRGLRRDGVSQETGLLAQWPQGGPRQVWKAQALGEGYAGLAIANGRIYTQGQRGDRQYVLALDAATGKKLWETPAGRLFRESRGNGPRGTPTVEGDRLFALAADGTLVCLETAGGKPVWSVNFAEQFGGRVPNWGYSESPLVDGAQVIVTPGGPAAAVVALEKRSGKVVWKSQSDRAGYSSPIVAEVSSAAGTVRQVVVLTGERAIGLRAWNGDLLWSYDKVSNRVANIATPIFRNGFVFLSTDYGTGCALLELRAEGDGVTAREVYFNRDMRNHYSSSVLHGEYLYGFSSAVLTAMNLQSGEVLWRDRGVGKGSLILAEGHLYLLGENGAVGLARATPSGYREQSRFQISRGSYPTWTPPAIADGRLYLRDQDALYCFDIQARSR